MTPCELLSGNLGAVPGPSRLNDICRATLSLPRLRCRADRDGSWLLLGGLPEVARAYPRRVVVVWLIIGAIAAGQRGYYSRSSTNCAQAGTVAVTVLAGPLNYAVVNPKAKCLIPKPSQ